MRCSTVKIGDTVAIVCGRERPKKRTCSAKRHANTSATCHLRATLLCDYPRPDRKSGTCDKPLCAHHAVEIGPNRHQCPDHPQGQKDLPL